jgi:hypothetical protein
MSLNEDQKDYVRSLNARPRTELCPCGWYTEAECVRQCYTGTRTNAPDLVRRIRFLYEQIDRYGARSRG